MKTTRMSLKWLGYALAGALASPQALALDSAWLSQLLLNTIPTHQLSASLLPALRTEAPSTALQFARPATTSIDIQRDGQWERKDGYAFWRLRIDSDNAVSLSATLGQLQLPASASLRLFDAQGQLWHGPISAELLQARDQFWTPIVPGDSLLLELKVSAAQQSVAQMRIEQIQHGDRSWDNTSKSGSCNIDTACSSADGWQDAVRATARITVGNRRLCSAVLLNNTGQDGSPLLLTANHCGIGESPDMSASSVVVYWNYETSQCGGSPNGSLRQFQQGSTLLASGADADFSLIQLDQIPPDNYQVFYAGWDARPLNPRSGASVHHPSGDEKRISFFNQQAEARTANVDGNRVQTWQVFWQDGITEPGSSGAGLWNDQQRVVGQLSGGNSSCSNQDAADVYGRLDASWQASSSASGQLRAWLDPLGTGQLTLDGRDSQTGGLKANSDTFGEVPEDSQLIALDVLSNDAGARPLNLVAASSYYGQVQIQGQKLLYQFDNTSREAEIHYQVMNRWGEVAQATVKVQKPKALIVQSSRGGALNWSLLLLMVFATRLTCRYSSKR